MSAFREWRARSKSSAVVLPVAELIASILMRKIYFIFDHFAHPVKVLGVVSIDEIQ